MNEVKKIHLDRQPFTISIEAHHELRLYLDAIERQLGKKGAGVLKEIELRMAELLIERGVDGEKVILKEDVDFLKEQLGKPGDFKDETSTEDAASSEGEESQADDQQPKRLYRDTDSAMIAGVASGLGAYLRIDPLIVRLLFVVLTFTGGAGILLYILLWILVPEAKSPSDRLQMRGKAVTVDNIKQLVDRADVPAVANRAGTLVGRILAAIGKVFLAVVGAAFVTAGVAATVWAIISSIYLLVHGGQVGTDIVFPIGTREIVLVICALVTAAMVGLMLILVGIAMVTRKWKVPAWAAVSIVGLFFVGSSVGTALAFDAVPSIRQRYRDAHKTQVRTLPEFKNLNLTGSDTRYIFKPSDTYSVSLSYMGKVNEQNVSTKVVGDTLAIDSGGFTSQPLCSGLCFYSNPDLEVTIYAPSIGRVAINGEDSRFVVDETLNQDDLVIDARPSTHVRLAYMDPQEVRLSMKNRGDHPRTLELHDIRSSQASRDDEITLNEESAAIDRAGRLELDTPGTCDGADPLVYMSSEPKELRFNGGNVVTGSELSKLQSRDISNEYNCVAVY